MIDSQALISGVPSYMWYRGCGPTAVGMVIGYWDGKGFDNLVPGSAATQTSAANSMMSSTGNYYDYCVPVDSYPNLLPDKSEPPAGDEHPDDCVADYMFTSQSAHSNYYGWSWNSGIRWCQYTGMRSGQVFGIYGGTFFSIVKASDQIAEAKKTPNGSSVTLRSVPVTAAFTGVFHVEETDRSCGIRVSKSSHGLIEGMRADVTGTVQTAVGGERYILASTAVANGSGGVTPVCISNRSVGGTDWNYNAASGAGQIGVAGGAGLNNIGMLVRTGGRVTYSATGFFYTDDGSGLDDGSGYTGIKVSGSGLASPAEGAFALVTGVVSCYKGTDGNYHPTITARTQTDITEIGN